MCCLDDRSPRPQGAGFDIGAYERISGSSCVAPFITTEPASRAVREERFAFFDEVAEVKRVFRDEVRFKSAQLSFRNQALKRGKAERPA
mgnify:CR=1 FL=1